MKRITRLQRASRGSNAIEFFFSIGPILFMTLAFVQFYMLANEVYFGITKGYARAFKEAYQADHTDDTDDKLGRDDMEADPWILQIWRPYLGGGQRRNWDPPGDLHMGGDGEYWIAGGSQADWWEVWDPAIGLIGLGYQYIDFPWSSASFSGLHPYDASDMAMSGAMNTGGMANQAANAQNQADQAQQDAKEEACGDMADMLAEQVDYRNRANACRSPAVWTQMTLAGQPLYYHKNDQGPGEDLYFMVNPPGEDDPDPADLVPAYPAQYYACREDDYIDKDGYEYGYSSAAQAQADYNEAVAAIAQTQAQMNSLGC